MENPYIKQYPDLMSGKKIMYVHGFGSSAQSGTVAMLRSLMPNATIVARDIPLHPDEAMAMLRQMCEEEHPDVIIGTSMGGMYTEMLTGYDRIVVNPAFEMGDTMSKFTGKQVFQNPREDGVQEFMVTKGLIKEYSEITTHCFAAVSDEERARVVGLFGDEDPVVHTFDIFSRHYPMAIPFHGEHRLTDKVAMHYLMPIIRYIDDRQEGRERPVAYLDIATLRDSYGHATASMHKAYEMLIEHYNVYIVAPSTPNNPQQMADDTKWVEQYLSAPAWGHLVFSNQRQYLYGDYLITPATRSTFPTLPELPEFMGTTIEWGSDEFKTWEEIIVFFDRLGGQ